MTGLIVFAHGSSVEGANSGVRIVSEQLAARGNFPLVETAFLELARPDLVEAVHRVVERGASRIVVVPFFLTLGIHLRRDLPGIVRALESIHEGVEIEVTAPLEGHPSLVDILLERAREAIDGGGRSAGETG